MQNQIYFILYKLILPLFLLIPSQVAIAGESKSKPGGHLVRNGGDVTICGNKVNLLDYVEIRNLEKDSFYSNSTDYETLLKELTNKIAVFDFERSQRLIKFIKSHSLIFVDGYLNNHDDEDIAVIPENCSLHQLAIHRSDLYNNWQVYISAPLWNRLTELEKAMALFHEFIWNESHLGFNYVDSSLELRKFNGWIWFTDFSQIDNLTYLFQLQKVGLRRGQFGSTFVALWTIDKYSNPIPTNLPNSQSKDMRFTLDYISPLPEQDYLNCTIDIIRQSKSGSASFHTVTISSEGKIISLNLNVIFGKGQCKGFEVKNALTIHGETISGFFESIEFNNDGKISSFERSIHDRAE